MKRFVFCVFVTALLSPAAIAGEITGRQYLTLGSGPRVIADNEIAVIPCAPVNTNCLEVIATYLELKTEHDLRAGADYYSTCFVAKNIDPKTREYCDYLFNTTSSIISWPKGWDGSIGTAYNLVQPFQGAQSVRTDFDGRFKASCPTQNCLLLSWGKVGLGNAVWFNLVNGSKPYDLTSSNAISLWNSK